MFKLKKEREDVSVLKKRTERAYNAFYGTALAAAIFGGCLLMSAGMGGVAKLTADASMNHSVKQVYETEAFQKSIEERLFQLADDYNSGKISAEEYNDGFNKLYSIAEVIEYSKTANDKDLSQLVSAYENTKEMGDTMFSRAVPWFSGMTALSAGAAAVSNSVYKKRKREEKFASEDHLVENSFDK